MRMERCGNDVRVMLDDGPASGAFAPPPTLVRNSGRVFGAASGGGVLTAWGVTVRKLRLMREAGAWRVRS